MATEAKKRKISTPPAGYACKICNVGGHWIQQCPQKSKSKKRKTGHIPVPGVDPSQKDIELAKELQKIKPPECFCGKPSRLKKVKKSNVNENSRAVGKYFFFCATKKGENPCRFARPVKEHRQRKTEAPPRDESTENDDSESAKVDESNPTISAKKAVDSEGSAGIKAPDGNDNDDNDESGSKKESGKSESPPQVSDGSKSSDSSSDGSSDDSSDDFDSSDDSSDEE